jgi:membrane protein YdbS with pleckstrin-like domain
MTDPSNAPDPSETDLYWSGQSGFAMLPGLVIGVLASAIVMLGLPPLGQWIHLPEDWIAVVRFWLVLVGWVALGLIWSYRGAAFVYRLTSAHLFLDFGIFFRPTPPISLASVTKIECRAWALRRLFHVGSVIVYARGRKPVRLRGIFQPQLFAQAIEIAVAKAQSGPVGPKAK